MSRNATVWKLNRFFGIYISICNVWNFQHGVRLLDEAVVLLILNIGRLNDQKVRISGNSISSSETCLTVTGVLTARGCANITTDIGYRVC